MPKALPPQSPDQSLQSFEPGQMNEGTLRAGRRKVQKPRREIIRLGKDEMNLVEHPFGVLWAKETENSVMFYQWDATHPITGKTLPASWTVSGHAEHGLPSGSDERVYLVLMELTREAGFTSHTVYFSRYDLIRRLGWADTAQSYDMIERAFERLKGVVINAKNAFWDHREKNYVNAGFNLIDHFVINAERPGPKASGRGEKASSFFEWGTMLFDSFQSGYIRSLDLDFALSLHSDIALRLYRYLDKKIYDGRTLFEVDIFNLCVGHLGMKPNLYPSKLKERLKPAHDELIGRGFLHSVEFEKTRGAGGKSEKVRYGFSERPAALEAPPEAEPIQGLLFAAAETQTAPQNAAPDAVPTPAPEPEFSAEQLEILERMEKIKVSPAIARELLSQWPASAIRHQLDCLADRKPRSKAATFVKSVRESWGLPDEYVARKEAAERAQNERMALESQEAQKARERAAEAQEMARLEEEGAHLDAMWGKLDEITRKRIDAEVEGKLGILGRAGRGEAARVAFRRAALRELLMLAQTPVAPPLSSSPDGS